MPDYASILKRSIETLAEKTPDMRQAVYKRARSALARQLTSVDPPLGPKSIELQHQHLEEAILVVEAEFSAAAGAGETPKGAGESKPPPAMDSDQREGQETAPPDMAQIEAEPSNKRWQQPKASRAPVVIMVVLLALVVAGAAVIYYRQGDTFRAFFEDITGEQSVAGTPEADAPASEEAAAPETAGGGEIADAPKTEDRLPGGVSAPLQGAQIVQPVTDTAEATLVDGGGSQSVGETAETGDAGGTQMAVSEAPVTEMPVIEAPITATPLIETPATETPATETPAPETPVTETPAGSETVDAITQGLVGQRAFFEEQGAEGAPGKSVPGVVAWSQITGENGLPAIVGRIELADRNAAVSLMITKNTDEALPASHLIEIEFRGADGLIDSPIEKVPALFAKQTAKARGKRLIGEAVPVTENLYWIALSDQGDQVSRNLVLLREGAWFGLPMLFENGRGAVITFEKGIPGDQVFEAVLAAWEKADAGQ